MHSIIAQTTSSKFLCREIADKRGRHFYTLTPWGLPPIQLWNLMLVMALLPAASREIADKRGRHLHLDTLGLASNPALELDAGDGSLASSFLSLLALQGGTDGFGSNTRVLDIVESCGSPESHDGCGCLESGVANSKCSFKMAEGSWQEILKSCQYYSF